MLKLSAHCNLLRRAYVVVPILISIHVFNVLSSLSTYRCRILLSAILPRAQSGFDNNRRSDDFLTRFNNIANEVNQTLRRATQSMSRISFVEFPQYIVNGEVQRHLLSKDGLHLSFEGTEHVVSNIEDQIFRTMWDLTKVTC